MRVLGEAVRQYVQEREQRKELRPTTARTVRYTLGTLVQVVGWDKSLARLRRADIERWMTRDDLGPATMRSQLSIVRRFCRWLLENGHAKVDPTIGIASPRQPRYMPRGIVLADVERTLDGCPDTRAELIVLLMLQEGLRCCEVASLQLGDIDTTEHLMIVRGKGGHERVLPITEETWSAIGRYLAEHPAAHGPLIRSYRHTARGVTAKHVSHLVGEWLHGAGVAASAHAARHTAATDMLRAGAHVRDVQHALGHQSLATTQRYMPWLVGDLRAAMEGRHYKGTEPGGSAA